MSQRWIDAGVVIVGGIVGVAVLAVLVSRQSQTAGVISASAGGLREMLCAALSPIGVNCRGVTEQVSSTITFPGV